MDASQEIAIRNRIVGILVKRARLDAGKSQRECAEFLGCSPSMFSNYERGRRSMSLPQLEALAYLFDVPVENLLDDSRTSSENEPEAAMPVEQIMLLRRKMLAVQFRQCRRTSGLSQRKMGQLLGCSASTVSQYERGRVWSGTGRIPGRAGDAIEPVRAGPPGSGPTGGACSRSARVCAESHQCALFPHCDVTERHEGR
jgi:transcriptional regulator with XRE-family HTH domain